MKAQWKALTSKMVLIAGLVGLLSACGFHLRGTAEVPEELQQVTLIPGNASPILLRSLQQSMQFNGIQQLSDAPYQIQILDHRYKRRVATLRSNSDVDEYELSLAVTVLITDKQGKPLTSDINLQGERIYSYDKNAAAASAEQEELLRDELYTSIAQSIMRRYLALKPAR